MTNLTKYMRTFTGKGTLQAEGDSETPVFYEINVFQTFIIAGNSEIPGLKNLEITIEITDTDILKIISFMNGKYAKLKLESGNELTIVPFETTSQGILAKLAPGNSKEVLETFD